MPMLFVPSSDGRLAAVAIDGLQNLVPANHDNDGSADKDQKDFRSWLLLLVSLVATVTFTAGLTPPGGFRATDDKANGYVAGTSVMFGKFPVRYIIFHCSNTNAFGLSLVIIAKLTRNKNNASTFSVLVALCFLSLECSSYFSGIWTNINSNKWTSVGLNTYTHILFATMPGYMVWEIRP